MTKLSSNMKDAEAICIKVNMNTVKVLPYKPLYCAKSVYLKYGKYYLITYYGNVRNKLKRLHVSGHVQMQANYFMYHFRNKYFKKIFQLCWEVLK